VASFNTTLVPVGSPASIVLTVDPANNFAAGAPGVLPNAGGYWFDAGIDFIGLHYNLHGAFEVNEDLVYDYPLPGSMLARYLSLTGPALDPSAPPWQLLYTPYPPCGPPCAYFYPASVDFSSPALPSLPIAYFSLYFYDTTGRSPITVQGTNPQAVPELGSGVLVLTGAILLMRLRRRS
jgi:hypothetical protein